MGFRSFARFVAFSALAGAVAAPCELAAADRPAGAEATRRGYYRDPALHGETIVFSSEGDLWTVSLRGGAAQRLTTAAGSESKAILSPDGRTVAFLADYEGPNEVYTMPLTGGLPQRRTWEETAKPAAWTPDGRLVVATSRYSTLPGDKLALIAADGKREIIPLAEAAEAAYSPDGKTLYFTRWGKQSSFTKRYKGGWIESVWKFDGRHEAVPLTADYEGTSAHPMVWRGRVYFLSDRDGVMNVWSMDESGKELKQESHQKFFDVDAASVSDGHIVYASGADLWNLDLASGKEEIIPITLQSDFEQMREHWVKKPLDYLTSVHLSPDGSSAVFTARGEVFTLPARSGRTVRVAYAPGARYREARFLPDGKSIVAVSTQTGETEFWKYPANGVGKPEQWTKDAKVLRWEGMPSPDGNWLVHTNKDQELWLYDVKNKQDKRIAQSLDGSGFGRGGFGDFAWSPDSKWLAFVDDARNTFSQIHILNIADGKIKSITSDRFNSRSPEWSSDGKWLYFLSDRSLRTTVPAPWGPRGPQPHFDKSEKIYQVALVPGLRSPFLPADELHPDKKEEKREEKKEEKKDEDKPGRKDTKADEKKPEAAKQEAAKQEAAKQEAAKQEAAKQDAAKQDDKAGRDDAKDGKDHKAEKKPIEVKIDFADLASRVTEIPVPPGNYNDLQATDKRLCWANADGGRAHIALQCFEIANKGDELETIMSDIRSFEISLDRKKLLIRKSDNFYVFDSEIKGAGANDLKAQAKAAINLSHWTMNVNPREEFRGLFEDAWRLERDYFYDRNMHGVNWTAMRDRYLPLVDRVATRDELNAVVAQMVGELSALHTFVRGGDVRTPVDHVDVATLGARLRRDEKAGGFVVEHIYAHDPDLPNEAPPLARPESSVKEGEVIVGIDGADALSVPDEGELLRGKGGTQVLLQVKNAKGETRDVVVSPISAADDAQMRYAEWEYTRRLAVEKEGKGSIGYVHLRAMGTPDIEQWARDFYPVYDRQGLIIDVRHNRGGNIDSWLLSSLLRQAWFYFQPRVGKPTWNMQYAFRGHIVVLCDHATASDGEAFSEGFRRLKLGKVLGTRTWGGEIWLSSSNTQADNGLASAAENGVYADGKWLIEGRGVEPDTVVDNLPHESFDGKDAQLEAAIAELEREIKADPRPVPAAPEHPNKGFRYSGQGN